MASHCSVAVLIALEAVGHGAHTVENPVVLQLMVVMESFVDKGVSFLRCFYINKERAM